MKILLWEMKLNWRYEAELEILLLGFNLGTWAAPQLMNVLSSAESKSMCACLSMYICVCACVCMTCHWFYVLVYLCEFLAVSNMMNGLEKSNIIE